MLADVVPSIHPPLFSSVSVWTSSPLHLDSTLTMPCTWDKKQICAELEYIRKIIDEQLVGELSLYFGLRCIKVTCAWPIWSALSDESDEDNTHKPFNLVYLIFPAHISHLAQRDDPNWLVSCHCMKTYTQSIATLVVQGQPFQVPCPYDGSSDSLNLSCIPFRHSYCGEAQHATLIFPISLRITISRSLLESLPEVLKLSVLRSSVDYLLL